MAAPAVSAGMKGIELTDFNAMTNRDKAVYLEYRVQKAAESKRPIYHFMTKWFRNLSAEDRRKYDGRVDAMAVANQADQADQSVVDDVDEVSGDSEYSYKPDQRERIRAVHAGRLQRRTKYNWKFIKTLYDTYERTNNPFRTIVSLYAGIDQLDIVNDRVVMKQVHCNPDEAGQAAHLQKEYIMTRGLRFCDNIVKFRKPLAVDDDNSNLFRIYSDYASSGDLQNLLKRYDPVRNGWADDARRHKQIPEPFIWLVFFSLAEALFALNTGRCAKRREARGRTLTSDAKSTWASLHHRDIKPNNVFLDMPENPYLGYPKPLLGDFDISVPFGPITIYQEGVNRQKGGTPTWQAPEVTENRAGVDLTPQTDVWGVAMIIWRMMHASLGRVANNRLRTAMNKSFDDDADTFPDGNTDVGDWQGWYTKPLHDLVRQCLKTKLEDRPNFLELRNRTRAGLREAQRILGNFHKRDLPRRLRLEFQKDEFVAIGLVLALPDSDDSDENGDDHPRRAGADNKYNLRKRRKAEEADAGPVDWDSRTRAARTEARAVAVKGGRGGRGRRGRRR